MRKTFIITILSLLSATAWAQSTQPVQILEYNGKEAKTPMQGVGLSVNNAASAMSDAQGLLTLTFRTLHAGDPVVIRRIEKAGYEVFNLEAVEQWNISPRETFQLVICKSDKIRQLCEVYNQAASESYGKQLQQEKERLAEDLKAGKLKEEEYKAELQKTEDFFAQQLENLDLYVEKFAHFDLSELSKEEQAIIELVQQGKIDEAISRYEQMDLLSKYQEQSKEIKSIRNTQDSLSVIREEKVIARDSIKSTIDYMEKVKKKEPSASKR